MNSDLDHIYNERLPVDRTTKILILSFCKIDRIKMSSGIVNLLHNYEQSRL